MSFFQAEYFQDDNEAGINDWQQYYAVPPSTQSEQSGHPTEHHYDSIINTPTQAMFNHMPVNLSIPSFSSSGPFEEYLFALLPPARPIDAEELTARIDYPRGGYSQRVPPYEKSPTSASCKSPRIRYSPYAQSDGYFQASPPHIKEEDSLEPRTKHSYSVPATPSYGYSSCVDPLEMCPQATSSSAPAQLTRTAANRIKLAVKQKVELHLPQAPTRPTERRRGEASGRSKRGFTTVENSTCQCTVCGKLFQRVYNLKAHMETHDPDRDLPHACRYPACERKFVRRTDLVRHEQSVHLKLRNFACVFCKSAFARKDTLRRHIEDGCPCRPPETNKPP